MKPGTLDGLAVVPHRASPSRTPVQRAMARKVTRCLMCNGRGRYTSARTREIVSCHVCKGSGVDKP